MCAAAVILVSNGSLCAGCKVEQGGRKKKGKKRKKKNEEHSPVQAERKRRDREKTALFHSIFALR